MNLIDPSYSEYKVKMDVVGGLAPQDDELDETLEALRNILFTKYPWHETLMDEGEVDINGRRTHCELGFGMCFK